MYKILLVIFNLIWSVQAIYAENNPEAVMVLGYYSHEPSKLWQNTQVGFGVQNQLKQVVFDSGRFVLKEEKGMLLQRLKQTDDTGQQQARSDQSMAALLSARPDSWMLQASQLQTDYLATRAERLQIKRIFWVEVVKFGQLGSELMIGPFSSRSKKTHLLLKVCVFQADTNSIQCAEGKAASRKKSTAFIYHAKRHHFGEKVFDGSVTGKLSHKAVNRAFHQLMAEM